MPSPDDSSDDTSRDEPQPPEEVSRHGDGQPAPLAFRPTRARHLRDEIPPPPPDPRRAAERADSTLPMPAVADPALNRQRPGIRTWAAAAGAFIVVVAVSFTLVSQHLGGRDAEAGQAPDSVYIPVAISPESSTFTRTSAPTPTATPVPSRSPSTRPTKAAVVQTSHASAAPPPAPPPAQPPPPPVTTTAAQPTTTQPNPPTGPTALPIVPHTGTLKVASAGKCLDDANGATTEANPIQLWPCNTTSAQKFSFGSDGTLRVVGKCIKPSSSSPALLELRTCDGSTATSWYFRSDKVIVNKSSGLCLTSSGSLTNGLFRASVATCTAASTQQWTFT